MSREKIKAITEIGGRVRNIRKILGLSQNEMARQMGMTGNAIHCNESGMTLPGYAFLKAVVTVYGVDPRYLFLGTEPMLLPNPDLMPLAAVGAPDKNQWAALLDERNRLRERNRELELMVGEQMKTISLLVQKAAPAVVAQGLRAMVERAAEQQAAAPPEPKSGAGEK